MAPVDATDSIPADGPRAVTPTALLLCALLLAFAFGGASRSLGLGLSRTVAIGAVRAVVQLSLLGYILVPVFKLNHPGLTLAYTSAMAAFAAYEATSRPKVGHMFAHALLAVVASAYASLFYCVAIVLRVGVDAHYLIPVMGMILGNTSAGCAVALGAVTSALRDKRDSVEVMLSMGATRWEAMHDVLKEAASLGLTPILNNLSIIGLVSIPGMMTGQILGGTAPDLAARYQIVIIFMIASSTALSVSGVIVLAATALSDAEHRLRTDLLVPRKTHGPGEDAVSKALARVGADAKAGLARLRGSAAAAFSRPRGGGSGGGSGGGGGGEAHAPLLDEPEGGIAEADEEGLGH